MTTRRNARLALFAAASGLALAVATTASAQTAPQAAPQDEAAALDDIIITGTRVQNRSRLDSLAPVDVVSNEVLENRGTTELAAALAATVPSLNFPRSAVVDGTDSVRPATLRGLSPDQTLVLVNGTRRHASALVNVNGSVGRGSAAVDLNTIPTGALDRIEVLRDGASAQYGSDAIAGVVNLRLREASSGGGATFTAGQYYTTVSTARREEDEQDGATLTASGWQGFGLGSDGFLTVNAEYLQRNPTNRADLDPRVTPNAVTARFGDPEVEQWTLFANAGKPLSGDWEAYGWAGYQNRDSESAAFPRVTGNANLVPALYSNGFLPKIAVNSRDLSAGGGVRGDIGGWNADFNLVYGRNALEFRTEDSLNSTYGAASPTSFDSGALIYDQLVFGADLTREFDFGLYAPANVAFGLEARRETYEIQAGQHESWDRGPLGANTALGSGAQGFPGFQPSNEIDEDRTAVGVYVDVEAPVTEQFTIAGAVRFEDYSDFGTSTTGKVSARYDFTPAFALRGSVSTGFRAPSLQQSYFTSTASVIQSGAVVETGTFPATSAVASVLGAKPLDAESSTNYTLGTVIRLGGFDLTIDAYRIEIEDQIALSENISGRSSSGAITNPQVAALLDPLGIQAARFFLNGVDTTTQGIDVVGRYRLNTEAHGDWDFTVAGNFNDVKVTRTPDSSSVLNPVPPLFARSRIETIQQGTPDTKITATTDWTQDKWGVTARVSYYASVLQPGSTTTTDLWTGDKTVADFAVHYQANERVNLTLGLDNAFDIYPDAAPAALNSNGVVGFPFYSPFGFNGRFAYVRVGLSW